jgi:pectin methylesterase-like acyl-CoA thioesterase
MDLFTPHRTGLPLFIFFFLSLSSSLIAQDAYVDPAGSCGGNTPCFTTIQAAIMAASPGEIIGVEPGTYNENAAINKNGIPLTGLGAGATIAGGEADRINLVANDLTIDNFTVT